MTASRCGRRSRLTHEDVAQVNAAIFRPPREHGHALGRWSLAAAGKRIQDRATGARYHPRLLGRLLRRIGWIVPPAGRGTAAAFRREAIFDPEGNWLGLHEHVARPTTDFP